MQIANMSDVSLNFSGDSSHDDGGPKVVEIMVPKKTLKKVVNKEKAKKGQRASSVPKGFKAEEPLSLVDKPTEQDNRPKASPPKYKHVHAIRGKSPASSRPPTGTRSPSIRSSVPDERVTVYDEEATRGRSPPTPPQSSAPSYSMNDWEVKWMKAHNEKIDLQNELEEIRRQRDLSASQINYMHSKGQDMLNLKDMEIQRSNLINENLVRNLAKTEAEEKDTTRAYEYEKTQRIAAEKSVDEMKSMLAEAKVQQAKLTSEIEQGKIYIDRQQREVEKATFGAQQVLETQTKSLDSQAARNNQLEAAQKEMMLQGRELEMKYAESIKNAKTQDEKVQLAESRIVEMNSRLEQTNQANASMRTAGVNLEIQLRDAVDKNKALVDELSLIHI